MTSRRMIRLVSVLVTLFMIGSVQVPAFAAPLNDGGDATAHHGGGGGGGGGGPPPGGVEPSTFGHTVIYLGVLTASIVFDPTCGPGTYIPPQLCVVLQAAPGETDFSFPNLASMVIPANSTKNTLLPSMTRALTYDLLNTTTSDQTGGVGLATTITIISPVLNLPTVINPNTGQPYDGTYAITFSDTRTARLMSPGEEYVDHSRITSEPIQGFDVEALLASNLPANVVQALFAHPMTIQVGLSGKATLMDSGGVNFGARFFGDN